MKQLLRTPNYAYHLLWKVLSYAACCACIIGVSIMERGLTLGIIQGLLAIIASTVCFGILVFFAIAMGTIVKYSFVFALPVWLFYWGCSFFEHNYASDIIEQHGLWYPLLVASVLTTVGVFNITTRIKAFNEMKAHNIENELFYWP